MEKRKNMPMLERKNALPVVVHSLIQTAENLVQHGGLECRCCGKNHFVRMYKTTKRVKKLDNLSSSESEDEYQVAAVQEKTKKDMTVNIKINAVPIQFQIDSVADVNIIDESSFRRSSGSVILKKTRAKIFP